MLLTQRLDIFSDRTMIYNDSSWHSFYLCGSTLVNSCDYSFYAKLGGKSFLCSNGVYQFVSVFVINGLLMKMVFRNVATVLSLLVFCTLNSKNKLI